LLGQLCGFVSLWLNRLVPIITLLTDFGHRDYFAGAMKGVILSINPGVIIVDISHEIPPQDIEAAAFNLLCCYKSFPAGTVHVAVVDPGVGSDRKPIVIECADQFFVGPDNGIFSWICERENEWRVIQLTNDKFFRPSVSRTFHGRDIFAPVAAALSKGALLREFGEPLTDIVRMDSIEPIVNRDSIEGRVIHIDHFGNCVTNLTPENCPRLSKLIINGVEIISFRRFFADGTGGEGELFGVIGSAGFIEIAAQNSSAAEMLKIKRGQEVVAVF
jgi:S-adenosylmethionine hydrolase